MRLGAELAIDGAGEDSSSLLSAFGRASAAPSSMNGGISPSSDARELSGDDSSDELIVARRCGHRLRCVAEVVGFGCPRRIAEM